MNFIHVTPAYGRDYKSLKAALADWNVERDFILQDVSSPYDGKPINKQQCDGKHVFLRYGNLRKTGQLQ